MATIGSSSPDKETDAVLPPATDGPVAATTLPAAKVLPDVHGPKQGEQARDQLRRLIAGIASTPADALSGDYTYVHLKLWAADDTLRAGGKRTTTIVTYEERRWRATDGSGRVTIIRPPGVHTGPPPGTFDYHPGELLGAIPEPLSSDPPILAGEFNAIQPWANGPQSGIRAVGDVYSWHTPGRDVRAALLQVLCDIDGLVWRGQAVDRAGRPGVAVSVDGDQDAVRDTAIFDPHSGQLLAHEMVRLKGSEPRLVSYALFLENGRAELEHKLPSFLSG